MQPDQHSAERLQHPPTTDTNNTAQNDSGNSNFRQPRPSAAPIVLKVSDKDHSLLSCPATTRRRALLPSVTDGLVLLTSIQHPCGGAMRPMLRCKIQITNPADTQLLAGWP